MAEQLSSDYFSCPLCTELLRDPVAIPCGHSFCMDCISGYWNEADYTGIYICPQCQITFTQRPVLRPNATLTKVAEKIKKTGLNLTLSTNGSFAGPSDVPCDFCTGKKLKAVKSCLNCLASYCEKHLKPHYESATFKRHKLWMCWGTWTVRSALCTRRAWSCSVVPTRCVFAPSVLSASIRGMT